ncbi:MAG: hypothetical protein COV91_01070 [Candidatus Taylorbacteria bacterium CG11_big_fil_rev_8_21_14_0_20_46_11]|uniref:Glycosyl transferase family 1 domain-containing protein n=1 Tax=Candidatus Taylorbacteria bacterium CG11_big_fil_rev_8_21_14_0_20_46_11 TaxID=1975025 RepID=A0A2H0KCT1_9BACT|nr:MAG: hypothetical protein COV91_01070 [Candidatus Taylorbacteria bacterium CG11_big_fil_rev_8_21_14_0_20_46_11]
MRILNISLDSGVLVTDSSVQKRLLSLAEHAGEITVLVPGARTEDKRLGERLVVHSFGGPKWWQFLMLWEKGKELSANFDLITVQDVYFLGYIAVRLGEQFSIPVEVQVHGFEKMGGLRARMAQYVITHATKIRVVSNRLRTFLKSEILNLKSEIYVLPVYTQIEEPGRKPKRNTVPYPFTFLTVGRLVSVKNIELQLNAFARLLKTVPHIRLQIVGEGPEKTHLQQTTNNLQLEDKVTFEGEQKEVGKYYAEADAFLLTSDSEGWGLVTLEAAAYRLPIIMTNVGLANEVLHNEKSCTVIPVGDEEQLYLAMKEFIDTPALRIKLGEGAYEAFKGLPSSDTQIKKQVEHWRSFT